MVPDQRWYSLSEKPRGVGAYRTDALTRDVLGRLGARGHEQADLAGDDWGAAVA